MRISMLSLPLIAFWLSFIPVVCGFCNATALNTTSGQYVVQENQTIYEIATIVNRGLCDIARYNRMADALIPLYSGESILVPPQVCQPDNSTCLIVDQPGATYSDCVIGGPHTYTTIKGDTMAYIALKLNITLDALLSTAWTTDMGSGYSTLEENQPIKIPQCSPSQCVVQPKEFVYGTYKDLAAQIGTTPGQLMAFNPTYNHTVAPQGEGPVITFAINCTLLSNNVTVIS